MKVINPQLKDVQRTQVQNYTKAQNNNTQNE